MKENLNMIQKLEELSLNSWPSLQTLLYDGWVIRFANGLTKRSNSISPIYHSAIEIDEKIRFCEKLYQEKGLDSVFKITSAVFPENLDKILDSKNYKIDSPTSVQTLQLKDFSINPEQKATFSENVTEQWLNRFCSSSGIEKHKSLLKKILTHIVPLSCFASLTNGIDEKPVALGLGVLQDKYLALYDIVTAKQFRKQGYGRDIVLNLLNWGKSRGAEISYLHVMHNNEPALKLYAKMGFEEVYSYWYRIKDGVKV